MVTEILPAGKALPNWKAALLVLLGFFPVAMLEMKFLGPALNSLPLHISVAVFVGSALALFVTCFVALPLFMRGFAWWLFPGSDSAATRWKGIAVLCFLYAVEVAFFWQLAG